MPNATKIVNGERVELSNDEQAALDAERAAYTLPVPPVVTMKQARLALLSAGLLPSVEAALAGMTGAEGEAARIEWEYSTEVRRASVLVNSIAAGLGLTDQQIDNLFIDAATR